MRWLASLYKSPRSGALQRRCQTLSTLCPLTNAQDYCASQFFWIYCSSDRRLRLFYGAESLTIEQKWPSTVVLQWTKSRFSNDTNKGAHCSAWIVLWPDCIVAGGKSRWTGKPLADVPVGMGMLFLHSFTPSEKSRVFFGFCCTEKRRNSLFYWVQKKNFGHWVGVLSRHPWCWISKYVLEHPQWHESCDLAPVVRFTNSSPLPRSYPRNRSKRLLLWHLLKPLQHLCQDLAPVGHS